jgi:hypothetical protein
MGNLVLIVLGKKGPFGVERREGKLTNQIPHVTPLLNIFES